MERLYILNFTKRMLALDFTLGAHLDMTLLQPARTLDCCFRLVLRLGQRGGRRSRTGIYLAQHISSALGPFAREMAQPSPACLSSPHSPSKSSLCCHMKEVDDVTATVIIFRLSGQFLDLIMMSH
jgi:hypothetical protein